MLKYLLIVLLFVSGDILSQGENDSITSFFLTEIPDQNAELLEKIPAEFHQAYLLDSDSLSTIFIWQDSIILKKTILFTLSMTEIIDNPDWYILNGKLHGVKKDMGLTFVEEDDIIVAAIEIDYPIWKNSERNGTVYQAKDQIRIFQKSDQNWMFYLINLNAQSIEIANFDHDPVISTILSWQNTKETTLNGYKTYLSSPSKIEFEALLNDDSAFKNRKTYSALPSVD